MAKKAFDVESLLEQAATKQATTKTNGSSIPVLDVADVIKNQVKELRILGDELKSKKTEYETISAEVLETVTPKYLKLIKGEYLASVRVPDTDGGTVLVTYGHKYLTIDPAKVDGIQGIMGDKFEQYIDVTMEVSIVDPTNQELMTKLIKAIGKEEFLKNFAVKKVVGVKPAYTKEMVKVFSEKEREDLGQFIVQAKPGIRT